MIENLIPKNILNYLRVNYPDIGRIRLQKELDLKERDARYYGRLYREYMHGDSLLEPDKEIIEQNVRLKKQTQRFQDSNRIERKSFREYARVENAIEEYSKQLVEILGDYNVADVTIKHESGSEGAAGIFHLTDPHFNELVDLSINKYDFKIAAKRCKKFIVQAKRYFKAYGVTNILFAMTGDILNSDRRLDELLNQATNRSQATFLAVQIIEQMLLELNEDFNITVACVSGNESRIQKDWEWSNRIATDNYDFTVFNILEYLFKGSKGIRFIHGDAVEVVVEVGKQKILLTHGIPIKAKTEESIQKIIGKYANRGIIIDFVLFGHLHSCRIGDIYARGASIVGANDYSDKGLCLISRASQNIHIIHNRNNRDSIKIDLQDTEGIEGYEITKELEAYDAKSLDKTRKHETIFRVTI